MARHSIARNIAQVSPAALNAISIRARDRFYARCVFSVHGARRGRQVEEPRATRIYLQNKPERRSSLSAPVPRTS